MTDKDPHAVADLPKVELHLHHEGGAPPALIRQIAFEKNLDISRAFDARGGYVFSGVLPIF